MDVSNKCRLCELTTQNRIEIFGKRGLKLSVGSIISFHFNIEVKETDFSKLVCKQCWHTTERFHKLYCRVKKHAENPTKLWDEKQSDNITLEEPITDRTISDEPIVDEAIKMETESNIFYYDGPYMEVSSNDKFGRRLKEEDRENEKKIDIEMESLLSNLSPKPLRIVSETMNDPVIIQSVPKIFDRSDVDKRNQRIIEEDKEISMILGMNCELCDQSTDKFIDLIKHYRDEHRITGYIRCCKRKYDRRAKLYNHIQNHKYPDKYKCPVCEKTFLDQDIYKRHVSDHDPSTKVFKCNQCTKQYRWKILLENHVFNVHENGGLSTRPFICDICNRKYKSKTAVSNHIMQAHSGQCSYICDVCAKIFRYRSEMKKHHKIKHTDFVAPKEQCTICGAWLLNRHSLTNHIRRHRAKEEMCNICTKICPNKSALFNHIEYVHRGHLHQCNVCDKTFKSQVTLKEHISIHTGRHMYKCLYCPTEFRSSSNMYKHRKNIHPIEWQQDRECGKRKRLKLETID